MAAAVVSSATASFLSPLLSPRHPRHFLRHFARAAATKPAPASASSLALPSPWPWARLRRLRELVPAEAAGRLLSSAAGSLIVALASASLVLGDTGAASVFVVSTPRKLQADELTTVRLFRENMPSVVYITNLAVQVGLPVTVPRLVRHGRGSLLTLVRQQHASQSRALSGHGAAACSSGGPRS